MHGSVPNEAPTSGWVGAEAVLGAAVGSSVLPRSPGIAPAHRSLPKASFSADPFRSGAVIVQP